MKFFDEMNEKYGFSDGGAYPDGIELYRDVYLKAVNKLAEARNSEFRIVPFDRGGVHNFCMWMVVPVAWFNGVFLPKQKAGRTWFGAEWGDIPFDLAVLSEPQPDEALEAAIADAHEMDLDGFLEVKVKVSPDFDRFLKDEYVPPSNDYDGDEDDDEDEDDE